MTLRFFEPTVGGFAALFVTNLFNPVSLDTLQHSYFVTTPTQTVRLEYRVCNIRPTEIAIVEEIYYGVLSCKVQHIMIQYLNNIVEQDHRFIKKIIKPMLGFKNFYSACLTISGIESKHMIKRGQAGTQGVLEEIDLISRLFCVA